MVDDFNYFLFANHGKFMSTVNEWSDASSDAFWEMVTDQLLFAKVTPRFLSRILSDFLTVHRFPFILLSEMNQ